MPRILKEQVILTKGKWVFKARIVLYNQGTVRRAELVFDSDPRITDEIGFTSEELVVVLKTFEEWKTKNSENF